MVDTCQTAESAMFTTDCEGPYQGVSGRGDSVLQACGNHASVALQCTFNRVIVDLCNILSIA